MMVAPLFHGEAQRKVIMPPGKWYDFWTGKLVSPGPYVQVEASELNIPVFVKDGSIMPVAPVTSSTADPAGKRLTMHVYGNGSLPWSSKRQTGVHCSWNVALRTGGVTGASEYTVVGWRELT